MSSAFKLIEKVRKSEKERVDLIASSNSRHVHVRPPSNKHPPGTPPPSWEEAINLPRYEGIDGPPVSIGPVSIGPVVEEGMEEGMEESDVKAIDVDAPPEKLPSTGHIPLYRRPLELAPAPILPQFATDKIAAARERSSLRIGTTLTLTLTLTLM